LARARAADLGQLVNELLGFAEDGGRVRAHFLQNRNRNAFGLLQHRLEQVLWLNFLIAELLGQADGDLHRFLRFDSEFIEFHGFLRGVAVQEKIRFFCRLSIRGEIEEGGWKDCGLLVLAERRGFCR
jgi:hypothetical protein